MSHYLDTSALAKLVLDEAQSEALRANVRGRAILSSDLVRTELLRAAGRRGHRVVIQAERLLGLIRLIAVDPGILDAAGRLPPVALRSLDAIHVQSALLLADELEAFVTYDDRMHHAARAAGLPVRQPGFG